MTTAFNSTRGTNHIANEAEATHNVRLFRSKPFGTYDSTIARDELEYLASKGCTQIRAHGSFWGWLGDKDDWIANLEEYASYCAYFGISIQYIFLEGVVGSGSLSTLTNELWYDPIGDSGARTFDFSPTNRTNPGVDTLLSAIVSADQSLLAGETLMDNFPTSGGWIPAPGNLFVSAFDHPTYPAAFSDPRGAGARQTAIREFYESMKDYFDEVIAVLDYHGVLYAVEVANEPDISYGAGVQLHNESSAWINATTTRNETAYREFTALGAALYGGDGTILPPSIYTESSGWAHSNTFRDAASDQAKTRINGFLNWFVDYIHATYSHVTTIGFTSESVLVDYIAFFEHDREPFTGKVQQYVSCHEYGDHTLGGENLGVRLRQLRDYYAGGLIQIGTVTLSAKGVVLSEFWRLETGDNPLVHMLYHLQYNDSGIRDDIGGFMWGFYETSGFSYDVRETKDWGLSPDPSFTVFPSTGLVRSRVDPSTGHYISPRRSDLMPSVADYFAGTNLTKPKQWQLRVNGGNTSFQIVDEDFTALSTTGSTKSMWRWAIVEKNDVLNTRVSNSLQAFFPCLGAMLNVEASQTGSVTGSSANEFEITGLTEADFDEGQVLCVIAAFGETDYDVSTEAGYLATEWENTYFYYIEKDFLFGSRKGYFFRKNVFSVDPVGVDNENFVATSQVVTASITEYTTSPFIEWSWDGSSQVTVTNNTPGSLSTDRALLLLRDVQYKDRLAYRMGFTLVDNSTATGVGGFVGFAINYSLDEGSGYAVYLGISGAAAIIEYPSFASSGTIKTTAAGVPFNDGDDFAVGVEKVPHGVRLRLFRNGSVVTWSGGDTFYDFVPSGSTHGLSGLVVSNFDTAGESVTFSDFYASGMNLLESPEDPSIRGGGHQTPSACSTTLRSSPFGGGSLGDLHEASRWVLTEANDSWETPKSDSGWSTSDLRRKTLNALSPRVLYRARVKYRNQNLAESPWSEPIVFAVDGTSANASTFNVPPFPTEIPIYQGFSESLEYATLVTEAESQGRISSRATRDVPIRTFTLKFNALASSEAQAIFDHYAKARGKLSVFEFIHPRTAEIIPVRYEQDDMSLDVFVENLYTGEITLVESLGSKVSLLASNLLLGKDLSLHGGA